MALSQLVAGVGVSSHSATRKFLHKLLELLDLRVFLGDLFLSLFQLELGLHFLFSHMEEG